MTGVGSVTTAVTATWRLESLERGGFEKCEIGNGRSRDIVGIVEVEIRGKDC